MPMPPPKASIDPGSDPRRRSEVKQLTRALRARGPLPPQELAELVGAVYWDGGRFDSALASGVADGLIVRDGDGRLAVTP